MYIRNLAALYILKNDEVLLMYKEKSRAFKNPIWVSIGGHFEKEDLGDPLACIKREMLEEIRITDDALQDFKLRYITLRKAKDELRNQYIYFAKLKDGALIPKTSDEGLLEWVKISHLFKKNMSVTNTAVLKHYFRLGTETDCIYGAIATTQNNVPHVEFTELRKFDTNY